MNQLKCLFAYPALQDENIDIREFNEFTPRKIPSYHRFEQSKRGKNLVSFLCMVTMETSTAHLQRGQTHCESAVAAKTATYKHLNFQKSSTQRPKVKTAQLFKKLNFYTL